jgi:hypothetical protein
MSANQDVTEDGQPVQVVSHAPKQRLPLLHVVAAGGKGLTQLLFGHRHNRGHFPPLSIGGQ